ncbi:translation initiation factor eIF-2A [Dichomitus squalens]|uniref:Eukaryotic translation initiation factor 2A n=2 Tax=Dichomitus squalens TaxID=114155 RepID=A0A4Q9PIS1_9APHY|nr:translation initiation factor eIF-2A [Dichomitus squalens LYAD-421 SS1]EJF56310.1 translation initiation factor eIF-2A [Dichomitus squalens LYAD-421 SS1]TBU40043.1 translation initiation factor eIF-2A [Dichomitus squalens]TBU53956.1 translation initiation factor eIF-2A [Dichomitus squalens]
MASQPSQQYAYRAQKSFGLVGGTPNYDSIDSFQAPEVPARTYQYSPDGRLLAYAIPTGVRIFQAESAQLLQELSLPNVLEIGFSPRGTYLSTWERPQKFEDGTQHKNLRIFSVSTGEELVAFSQKSQEGWELQYTISESHAVRLVGQEIQVFRPAEWSKGVVDKLKVEGATSITLSPGLNPSVAVFVAEKKGQPATVKIYSLTALNGLPTCQKTFFKAQRSQIKWNTLGTQVLVLTATDVDQANKSYYGETGGLYLLSAAGNFDCRVTLDKDGPVHDLAWSPNSKEFVVSYGFMPAKTMLFDQRARTLHDFGTAFCNFISFNPQGRLLAIAGFGNLAGKVDIYDRRTLNKVTSIDASNTSHCEWSPDGRFLLTATLSPRLRVDNGIKIWHCTGPLVHVQLTEELYQVSWRPTPVDALPPFPQNIPPAPAPAPSVLQHADVAKPTPTKPAGAYRPPGLRGLEASAAYKREDGTPSGQSTPNGRYSRSPAPGRFQNGRKHVPGAPTSPSPVRQAGGDQEKRGRKRKGAKDKEKKEGGKKEGGEVDGGARPSLDINVNGNGNVVVADAGAGAGADGADGAVSIPPTPGADGGLDPIAKKVRNLTKKLKAIDELKDKQKKGERLEATQLKKIETEAEIRKELAGLGINP